MNNKLIIFPTDTVYGIGCSIYDLENQKKIYQIKNRPLDKPLAILCASKEQIKSICQVNDIALKLIDAFLPGPLTIILKSKPKIKEILGLDTLGVRIPNCKVALDLLTKIGPMATTSVNESGKPSINEYNEIVLNYKDLVDEIYKPTEESSNLPSTVVMVDLDVKILRQGAITISDIEKVI